MNEELRGVKEELSAVKQELEGVRNGANRSADEVVKLQPLVGDVQLQMGKHHQDVRGWLGGIDTRLEDAIGADDGTMERLDFIVTMLMAVRSDPFDTPRHACILPPWHFSKACGLTEDEQMPEVWVRRLQEWQEDDFKEGKAFFKKKKRLFLVCAHTHRLVPCGPNGQGYDIQQTRTWFRMSVKVATFTLQMMSTTLSAMVMAPLSGAGAAWDAAAEATVSAAAEKIDSMLQDRLAGLTLDDGGAAADVASQVDYAAKTNISSLVKVVGADLQGQGCHGKAWKEEQE